MKRIIILVSLIMAIVLCAEDARDFYPVGLGYEWVYRDSTADGFTNSTETVIDMYTDMGADAVDILQETTTSTDTITMQFRTDGIYLFEQLLGDMGMDFEVPMRVLPDPFSIGDEWLVFEVDTVMEIMGFPVDAYIITHGEIIGFETVNAPAGEYECIKTEMTTYYEVSSTMFEDSMTYVSFRHWLAEDVGIVKEYAYNIDFMSGGGTEDISYLISFSTEGLKENTIDIPDNMTITSAPNPFNGAVSIDAPASAMIKIYDIDGKLIENLRYERIWTPDNGISSGVYIIEADNGEERAIDRVSYIK